MACNTTQMTDADGCLVDVLVSYRDVAYGDRSIGWEAIIIHNRNVIVLSDGCATSEDASSAAQEALIRTGLRSRLMRMNLESAYRRALAAEMKAEAACGPNASRRRIDAYARASERTNEALRALAALDSQAVNG